MMFTPDPFTPSTRQMLEEDGDDMTDIVSAPRMVVTQFIRHHLPISSVNLSTEALDSLVVQVSGSGQAGGYAAGAMSEVSFTRTAPRKTGHSRVLNGSSFQWLFVLHTHTAAPP